MAKKEIELRVVASSLEGSGDAKMCAENMERMGLADGDEIDITKGKYSVLLYVYEDTIYDPEAIRLKSEDIFLLSAREGDWVDVSLPTAVKPQPAKDEAQAPEKKSPKKKRKRKKSSRKKKR